MDEFEELISQIDQTEDPGGSSQLHLFAQEEDDGEGKDVQAQTEQSTEEDGPSSHCEFCGRYADRRDPSTYKQVVTWVGGTKSDSSVLRTYTGSIAHRECIDLVRSGVAPGQASLDDLVDAQPERADVPDDIFTDKPLAWRLGYRDGVKGVTPVYPVTDPELSQYRDGYAAGEDNRQENEWQVDAQPDSCPRCGASNPNQPGEILVPGNENPSPCLHPWHLV